MPVHPAILLMFRVLASCTSMMMILSPLPLIYRIHKTHQTGLMSIFPLISIVFNCYTWMLHGYLDENFFPVFTTFGVGTVIALCYVVVFYRWTSNRAKANRLLAVFGSALLGATAYALFGGFGLTGQTRHEAAQFAGYIAISSSLVLYTSPLEKLLLVFKHKSAVFIPIHMVIAGSVNNTMWIIYTSLAGKWLMFFPNIFTLTVGIFQIVLYFFVYNPKTHPYVDASKGRSSTATTEEDDSDNSEGRDSEDRPSEDVSVAEDCDVESGSYVAVATPTASCIAPEMLV